MLRPVQKLYTVLFFQFLLMYQIKTINTNGALKCVEKSSCHSLVCSLQKMMCSILKDCTLFVSGQLSILSFLIVWPF